MTAIHETAYPRLKSHPSREELLRVYSLTDEELSFVRTNTRQPTAMLSLSILLKTFQRLGYFVQISKVPHDIIEYIAGSLELKTYGLNLESYDSSGARQRHVKIIRSYLDIKAVGRETLSYLKSKLLEAATTKDEGYVPINCC